MTTLALLALLTQVDLSYSITSRTAQPVTGERVTFDIRVANAGPDAAPDVAVAIQRSIVGSVFVDLDAPAGWQCNFERYSDLQIVTGPEAVVGEGGDVRHAVTVMNRGPDEARDVAAVIQLKKPVETPIVASGPGWTCTTTAPHHAYCTRPSLAAGAGAPIEVQFRAPASETTLTLSVMPLAELNYDTTTGFHSTTVFVGSRESWRMMLVPLVNDDIPGANGSRWRTSLIMLLRSEATIEVQPERCTFIGQPNCTDFDAPAGWPFDPRVYGFVRRGPGVTGQFVYVRAADAGKVGMSTRTWDQSRDEETAGAGVSIPTESKFDDLNVLLNIPVAPEYRHTLRIYDADGRSGARVAIRLYANDELQPRVTLERSLAALDDSLKTTTARLPVSFVSITNNATHHVTTVTPQ